MATSKMELAIYGGPKVRTKPMPSRRLFGEPELEAVRAVFRDSWQNGVDFGYQGEYERLYTEKFCEFQGGGFADAVSSGTAAIYLALSALDLEAGSDVVVSPVTDPGCTAAVVIHGCNVIIADSAVNSFNVGPKEFEEALTPNTRAAVLTHSGGRPIEMDQILDIARRRGIKMIEDCSQAHGALYKGNRVGRWGDIAGFSTMYSKNHATGGCGGIVYTEKEDYYRLIRSLADRGKPFGEPDFDAKDPSQFLFPALNFNLDELSCAIGVSTLERLAETIEKRYDICHKMDTLLLAESSIVSPIPYHPSSKPSIFFHTVQVATDQLTVSKEEFAKAVGAEGIWINPHYRYVVSEWKWLRKFVKGKIDTPNARSFRDRTFNILFNERFLEEDIRDIVNSILKVESAMSKASIAI